jgi:hypothetical protein
MAVKHILRFVASMIYYGLYYARKYGEARSVDYNGSDLTSVIDTRARAACSSSSETV